MKPRQIDYRSVYVRCGWVETTCDRCGDVVLASENRWEVNTPQLDMVVCQTCLDMIHSITGEKRR